MEQSILAVLYNTLRQFHFSKQLGQTPSDVVLSPVFFALFDNELKYVDCNHYTCELLQRSAEEIKGTLHQEFAFGDDLQDKLTSFAKNNLACISLEVKIKKSDFIAVFQKLLNGGVVIIGLDVTVQVKQKKQLELSQKIVAEIRNSLELRKILNIAVDELKKLISCDRVIVYQFNEVSPSIGRVVAESITLGYRSILGRTIKDECFNGYKWNHGEPEIVVVHDVLDSQSECYRNLMKSLGVRSSMFFPILLSRKVWGMVVCHHREIFLWNDYLEIVKYVASHLSVAIAQSRKHEQIRQRELYLESVSKISQRLLGNQKMDAIAFNQLILECLETLGRTVKAHRCYLFKDDPAIKSLRKTYYWTLPEYANVISKKDILTYEDIPTVYHFLKSGQVVDSLKDFIALNEKEAFKEQGIASLLLVPAKIEDQFYGFIGFTDCTTTDRIWSKVDHEILKASTGIIFNAIGRWELQQNLEETVDRRTHELLTERKQLLRDRALFQGGPVIVTRWNKIGNWPILYVSPNVKDQLGFSPNLLLGKSYLDFVDAPDRERVIQEIESCIVAKKQYYEHSYRLLDASKQSRIFYVFNQITLRDTDPDLHDPEIDAYLFDVSPLVNTLSALESSEKRLETVINLAPLVLYTLNPKGEITFVAGEKLRLLGLDPGSLIGRSAFALFRRKPDILKITKEILKVNSTANIIELDNLVYQNSTVLTASGVIGVAMDITELYSAQKELEHFAYVASHDLQEPLRAIANHMELLRRVLERQGKLQETELHHLGRAFAASKRLSTLLSDLLVYSRIERKGSPFAEARISDVVADAVEALASRIEETQAKIDFVSPMPTLICDRSQMSLLFQNLISNALKFQPANQIPEITIGCAFEGRYWKFWVADNGIGISPQYYEKIFKAFTRLHKEDEFKGTGIGLAICEKIVKRHKGKIWITSDEDGSVFYFTIPIGQATGSDTTILQQTRLHS